ncbi:hypothetical protein IFO70_14840 [Phormidium tenue FACHB-886]|nr:hypothetical protein [Phormidium tenue FACHB-886]
MTSEQPEPDRISFPSSPRPPKQPEPRPAKSEDSGSPTQSTPYNSPASNKDSLKT